MTSSRNRLVCNIDDADSCWDSRVENSTSGARAAARFPATSIGVNCAGTRMRVLASQTGNESVPKILRINDAMNLS